MHKLTTEERFWAKVDKTDTCWLWTAGTTRGGYGNFWVDGVTYRAHCYAWEMVNGPRVSGVTIDHICHRPACVNPAHLRIVSTKQNSENLTGAYRTNASTGVRGVTYSKRLRKYIGHVRHNGERHHVGCFDSLDEADRAVSAKRRELFTHSDMDTHLV